MNPAQKRAVAITLRVLDSLSVRAGQSEREVARGILRQLRGYGARPAFRTIVASGTRSAIPHGYATAKKIRPGELVVIDFGALYNGYRTDVTRTFVVGKPNGRQRRLIGVVKQAQRLAIKAVRPGRACREIDRIARGYIAGRGFGKYFIHSTGHGVGTRVHQAPKISSKNHQRLKTGQVIDIEPGIYIKGWGGIRIEDMLEVTGKGYRVLTR